jgi:tetratricopeptide (TPR) repeat protein
MRLAPLFLIAAAFSMMFVSPLAAQSLDQFGQAVDPALATKVDQARQMRLPGSKSPDAARDSARKSAVILQDIVKKRPDYYRAWFNLGLALNQTGDYAGAKAAFEQAIALRTKLSIKDISLLNSAGWAAMQNGDYASAETWLLIALKDIDQGSASTKGSIYYNLGQLHFFTQRFDQARAYLKIARDQFGSQQAVETLRLIEQTKSLVKNAQSLKR